MRLPYSENAKKVLIEAENIAASYSNPSVGTEHILYRQRAMHCRKAA